MIDKNFSFARRTISKKFHWSLQEVKRWQSLEEVIYRNRKKLSAFQNNFIFVSFPIQYVFCAAEEFFLFHHVSSKRKTCLKQYAAVKQIQLLHDLYKFESSFRNFDELKLACVNEYTSSWYDREAIEVILMRHGTSRTQLVRDFVSCSYVRESSESFRNTFRAGIK